MASSDRQRQLAGRVDGPRGAEVERLGLHPQLAEQPAQLGQRLGVVVGRRASVCNRDSRYRLRSSRWRRSRSVG